MIAEIPFAPRYERHEDMLHFHCAPGITIERPVDHAQRILILTGKTRNDLRFLIMSHDGNRGWTTSIHENPFGEFVEEIIFLGTDAEVATPSPVPSSL